MLAAPPEGRTVKRIIAIILIVPLLLIASPASASSSIEIFDRVGDGTWIGDTWEVNVYPGEVKATTLTLYNSSSESAEVELTILPDSLDNGNLLFELDKSGFTMPGKSHANVTLAVKASPTATPGTYTSELRITKAVSPPSVTTNDPIFVFTRFAILYGSLDSLGTASKVNVYFEWGETTDYGSTTRVRTMTKPRAFRAIIWRLTPATTYHFRAVAVGDGTSYGEDMSFTTRGRWWWR